MSFSARRHLLCFRYERCIIAQFMAIDNLQHFPLQNTFNVLTEAVQNEKFFYRVRSRAALCLTEVSNRLPEGLITGRPPLIDFFEKQFGSAAVPSIPALHNFVATSSNLQQYFLMSVSATFLFSCLGVLRREVEHVEK